MAGVECTSELHVSTLAGQTCVVQASESWTLHDLQVAVQAGLGVPADVQRLVAGAVILAGSARRLDELLPECCTDILCVRSQAWCIIPKYSGNSCGIQKQQEKYQCMKISVDEAKQICEDGDDFMGFTFFAGKERITLKQTGFSLGLHNNNGFTHVQLTPAGRQAILRAIRQTKGNACKPFVENITDLETVLLAVQEDASVFKHVCHQMRNNFQIVKAAIRANALALKHASEEFQSDREMVRAAILQNPFALQFASAKLQADRDLVLLAVQNEPTSLRYAAEALRADLEICLTAVQQDGMALKYASAELRQDRNLVLTAMVENPEALHFASPALRSDEGMITATKKDTRAVSKQTSAI